MNKQDAVGLKMTEHNFLENPGNSKEVSKFILVKRELFTYFSFFKALRVFAMEKLSIFSHTPQHFFCCFIDFLMNFWRCMKSWKCIFFSFVVNAGEVLRKFCGKVLEGFMRVEATHVVKLELRWHKLTYFNSFYQLLNHSFVLIQFLTLHHFWRPSSINLFFFRVVWILISLDLKRRFMNRNQLLFRALTDICKSIDIRKITIQLNHLNKKNFP